MVSQESEMDSCRARPNLVGEERRDEGSLLPSDRGIYPEARRQETAIRASNEIANRPYLFTSLLPYFFIPAASGSRGTRAARCYHCINTLP